MNWFDKALADGRLEPSKVSMLDLALPLLWRVYPEKYGVGGFNGTALGNARFSPLDITGAVVPVLYGGGTLDVALMATVWHDAATPSEGFIWCSTSRPRRVAWAL